VKRLLGPQSILCSPQALYSQMTQLGWIATTGLDHTARKIAIGAARPRVLHLKPGIVRAIDAGDEDANEADNAAQILEDAGL